MSDVQVNKLEAVKRSLAIANRVTSSAILDAKKRRRRSKSPSATKRSGSPKKSSGKRKKSHSKKASHK